MDGENDNKVADGDTDSDSTPSIADGGKPGGTDDKTTSENTDDAGKGEVSASINTTTKGKVEDRPGDKGGQTTEPSRPDTGGAGTTTEPAKGTEPISVSPSSPATAPTPRQKPEQRAGGPRFKRHKQQRDAAAGTEAKGS